MIRRPLHAEQVVDWPIALEPEPAENVTDLQPRIVQCWQEASLFWMMRAWITADSKANSLSIDDPPRLRPLARDARAPDQ